MSSDTYSRQRFPGRPAERRDDDAGQQVDPRSSVHRQSHVDDDSDAERGYRSQYYDQAPSTQSGGYEEDDDAERLYESFSDLYEDFDEGRSKTPFVIIGALLAVAIVGGGLAFAYKRGMSDGADQPVIIRADQTATKVEPVDPGGVVIPHQDRRIYDQVTGQETPEGETALAKSDPADTDVTISETGFASLDAAIPEVSEVGPAIPSDLDEAPLTIGALASRVAAGDLDTPSAAPGPGSTSAVQAALEKPTGQVGETAASTVQRAGDIAAQPRRVRTVSIGPDGRVVTSDGVSELAPASSARALAPALPQPSDRILRNGLAPITIQPAAAVAPSITPEVDQGLGIAASAESTQPATAPSSDNLQTTLFAPSPRPKPRPTTQGAAVQRAATQTTASLRPQTPVPAPSASVGQPQGFAVQVASHRRQAEAVAKFADLQQRYPSLISGYQPLIQRADLGEKGIYFRLRIGPVSSRDEAGRLCESLLSAGLPGCLVRPL